MHDTSTHFDQLKPWRVCRALNWFADLASANAFAAQHRARFVHVMPESTGASAWELVAHCEREATARDRLAELQADAPPGVRYAVFSEGGEA